MKVQVSRVAINSSTATQVAAANPDRIRLEVYSAGSPLYVGDASVTSGTGYTWGTSAIILNGQEASVELFAVSGGFAYAFVLEVVPS